MGNCGGAGPKVQPKGQGGPGRTRYPGAGGQGGPTQRRGNANHKMRLWPPDVRKGSAFPELIPVLFEAMPPRHSRSSSNGFSQLGPSRKGEPFRTSGGKPQTEYRKTAINVGTLHSTAITTTLIWGIVSVRLYRLPLLPVTISLT